ncbi:MAG: transposase [Planctomycetaceae bacterium]|nr:transposase [Planctomycetaceae bacterium]
MAVRFKVSESWVRCAKQQRRETGQVAPQTAAPRAPQWKAWADWLKAKVDARPDAYLRELQAELKAERNEEVCLATICSACRALGLTRKKTLIASEQERPDVAAEREKWRREQSNIPPQKAVFIDETWAKTCMTRTYGRSPIGTRLIEKVPSGRWETTTFLGALRADGFIAPLTVDGAINGELFLGWGQAALGPCAATGRYCRDG